MTIELKLSFVQNPSCLPLSLVVSLDVCRFSQEELRPKFEAVAGAKKRLFDFERWKDEECGFSDGDKFMSSDASTNSIVGHNCWMGHLFHLVASVTWISELESVHQILPLGWSCRIFYSAAYVSHFFSQQKVLQHTKRHAQKFLEWFEAFLKRFDPFVHFLLFATRSLGAAPGFPNGCGQAWAAAFGGGGGGGLAPRGQVGARSRGTNKFFRQNGMFGIID